MPAHKFRIGDKVYYADGNKVMEDKIAGMPGEGKSSYYLKELRKRLPTDSLFAFSWQCRDFMKKQLAG